MSEMIDKLSGGQVLGLTAIVVGGLYLTTEAVAKCWMRIRRADAETALKRELVAAGKSVEEVERIVQATAGKRRP
jgi:hypothetical protein